MKNLHLLPTEKPSRLFDFMTALVLLKKASPNDSGTNQNIYITNNEEIKKGDWVNEFILGVCQQPIKVTKDDLDRCLLNFKNGSCKKIILTTDQDLINDGVQAIDDDFLEWFVENPSCESVEIKLIEQIPNEITFGMFGNDEPPTELIYKIIIPQEELKQETIMKQTALSWLETRVEEREKNNPNETAYWHLRELQKDFEKAKIMEKQQIIFFTDNYVDNCVIPNENMAIPTIMDVPQYYNKTFKNK